MSFLDVREIDLINLLKNLDSFTVKQLTVADIWIGVSGEIIQENGLIIERKSVRDLEASILDGRYREQRGRILAFCEENKAKPMYIIEGSLSSLTGRLQKSAIMKFINRLVLHYNIPVIYTESVSETSELIKILQEQWNETDIQKTIRTRVETVKVTDGIHIQKKVNSGNHRQFAIICLANCPGVSVKMAEILIDVFGSLKGVIEATRDDIEKVKVGNRKIGPVVSARLHNMLNGVEII
jgi:ERCC4-type nuclease